MIKKKLMITLLIISMALSLAACNGSPTSSVQNTDQPTATPKPTPAEIAQIEVQNKDLQLKPGDTVKLDYNVYPAEAATNSITITSSNPEIVQIESGCVKAVGDGEAVVLVSAENGVSASCNVKVKTPYKVKGELTIGTYELSNGQTLEYFSDYKEYVSKYYALTSYQKDNWSFAEDGLYVKISGTVSAVTKDGRIDVYCGEGSSDENIDAYLTPASCQDQILMNISEGDKIEAYARIDAHSIEDHGFFTTTLYYTLYDGIIVSLNSNQTDIPKDFVPVAPK